MAAQSFGLPEHAFKIIFRGREKPDTELLLAAGIKSGVKIFITETAAYRESQPDPATAPSPPPPAVDNSVPATWMQFGDVASAQPLLPHSQQPQVEAAMPRDTSKQQSGPHAVQLKEIAAVAEIVDGLHIQAEPYLSVFPGQDIDQSCLRRLIEQLTQQLLKLDNVIGAGEIRTARKAQIARIEALSDRLERLRTDS